MLSWILQNQRYQRESILCYNTTQSLTPEFCTENNNARNQGLWNRIEKEWSAPRMHLLILVQFSSVQLLSHVRLFATHESQHTRPPCPSPTPGIWCLPKLMSIESVMPSSHLILCHPLLLLPPIPPSIRVISNESTLHLRWPKYWSFSFSISPSNEHPRLI